MLKSKFAHAKGRVLLVNEERKSLSNSPLVLQENSYAKDALLGWITARKIHRHDLFQG